MVSETNLDQSFPTGQFHIHGFLNSLDSNSNDGGLLFYVLDIPLKLILGKMTKWKIFCGNQFKNKSDLFGAHIIQKNDDTWIFERN